VEINSLLKMDKYYILNFDKDENIIIRLNKNLETIYSTNHIELICNSISKLHFKSSYVGQILPGDAKNYINQFIHCCNLIDKNEFNVIVKKIQMLL
jgi:hypothetical protein